MARLEVTKVKKKHSHLFRAPKVTELAFFLKIHRCILLQAKIQQIAPLIL